jgi:hypothetical protein
MSKLNSWIPEATLTPMFSAAMVFISLMRMPRETYRAVHERRSSAEFPVRVATAGAREGGY